MGTLDELLLLMAGKEEPDVPQPPTYEGFQQGMEDFRRELAAHFETPMRMLFGGGRHDGSDTADMEIYYAHVAKRQEELFRPLIKLKRSLNTTFAKARMGRYRRLRGVRRPKFARINA